MRQLADIVRRVGAGATAANVIALVCSAHAALTPTSRQIFGLRSSPKQ